MKSPNLFFKVFLLALLLSLGIDTALASEKRGLGLRPPSLADMAEDARSQVRTLHVLPNKLAVDRLNAERVAKGLPTRLSAPPVRFGEEVISFSPNKQASASGLSSSQFIATTPERVDNSTLASFPPIRSQGTIGSCAAFSSVYSVGTHMLGAERGTNARNDADNSTKLSPKFIYNLVNEGADNGSWFTDIFQCMIRFGAPSWEAWPYVGDASNPKNYLEWPVDAADWREAVQNRFDHHGVVENIHTPTGLQNAKQLLASGYLLLLATDVYGWQETMLSDDPSTNLDNDLAGQAVCWMVEANNSGHAMTVVGYNDNVWTDINRNGIVDSGEKGALKIANSWGTDGWGNSGFLWIAYDALGDSSAVAGVDNSRRAKSPYGAFWYNSLYWITAKSAYSPTLLGEFTVSHSRRRDMGARLGISPTGSPEPQEYLENSDFRNLGGAWAFDGGSAAVDSTFVLDFTDVQSSGLKRYFLAISDSAGEGSAVLKSFRLTSPGGVVLATATSGVPATANGNTRFAFVDFGGQSGLPVVSVPAIASGRVGQPFSLSINATNAPTSFAASGLPPGLALNAASGLVSGIPSQAGSFSTVVSASNGGGTGTGSIFIEVAPGIAPAPLITSETVASGRVGDAFSYTIVATNNPTVFSAAGLPFGLSCNPSSGLIFGTPTQAGISAVALSASNAGGTGTRSLTLSIESAVAAIPRITSEGEALGASGSLFLYRITADNSPASFNAVGLPDGLSVNIATGEISGVLPAARVYNFTVMATNASGTGTKDVVLTVTGGSINGPANDRFSNRVPLAGANATASGSNVRATMEAGERSHFGQGSHSAWWTWVAPRTSKAVFSLAGSSFDTVLAVYSGGSLNSLVLVQENDDAEGLMTSRVEFEATSGTAYQLAVDGYGDAQGDIQLTVSQSGGAIPPPNNDFASAQVLHGTSVSAKTPSLDATAELGEPYHAAGQPASKSVWWRWTAPANGQATIDTTGSDYDTLLAVYSGDDLSSLTQIAADDQSGGSNTSRVSFPVVAGTSYSIAVDGKNGMAGFASLNINFEDIAPAGNDDFEEALILSGTVVDSSGDSQAATAQPGEPSRAGYAPVRSLWWVWAAPATGTVRISTAGSSFDTVVGVYRGDSIFGLLEEAFNDDARGLRTSEVEFDVVEGRVYRIAVDGYKGASGIVALTILLQTSGPSNNQFSNATELYGDFASDSVSNALATDELGEPLHGGSPASNSLWWSWIAPRTAIATFDTFGSNFDTVLAVYSGNAVSSLTPIGSNDDFGSERTSLVSFMAEAGKVYRIAVDGYKGAKGIVGLSLEQDSSGIIYETNFDSFPPGANALEDYDGWSDTDAGTGSSGIFEYFPGNLAGWLGFNPTDKAQVSLYRNLQPSVGSGRVEFSVDFSIQDSTQGRYDDFLFEIWNAQNEYLGSIVFENESLEVWRGDGINRHNTQCKFSNSVTYTLAASIDIDAGTWSAFLGDTVLFIDQPITATNHMVGVGSIDLAWSIRQQGNSGDNYMVFDNYRISSSQQVPVLTSPGQAQAAIGDTFSYRITASHGPISYAAEGLHAGLACNDSTGEITGLPQESGTRQVILYATNSAGSGSKVLLLSVESPLGPPVVTSSEFAGGKQGVPFSYNILATNSPASYAASVLPVGLAIDRNSGKISGTPTLPGTFAVTISATNSAGTGNASLALVIAPNIDPTPQVNLSMITGDFLGNFESASLYGQLALKIGKKGSFSGKVLTVVGPSAFSGKFDGSGQGIASVRLPAGALMFTLKAVGLEDEIWDAADEVLVEAVLQVGSEEISMELRPAPRAGGSVAPLVGKTINTLFESRNESGKGFGYGFASVKPGQDGVFRFAGSLADGTKLTGTSRAVEDGSGGWKLPVAMPLASVKGFLHGEATIDSSPAGDGFHLKSEEPWTWTRPANAKARSFQLGFTEELNVRGREWTWTKGTSVLGGSLANFMLTLSAPAGSVTSEGADSLSGSLPASNQVAWNEALPKGFSMKITPSTGLISGKVPAMQGGKVVMLPYQGILFSENVDTVSNGPVRGAGFVTGNGSSGAMEISQP